MRLALVLALLCLSCHRDDVKADDAPKSKKTVKKATRTPCAFPKESPIVTKVEIGARCDVLVERDVHVGLGGALVIGAGTRLAFAARAGIVFDGGTLTARGTRDEPVLFTGTTEQPGSWYGLSFPQPETEPGTTPEPLESSIDHAIVEFAGGGGRSVPAGITVAARTIAHLALSHVTFRSNASRGLYVYDIDAYAGGRDLVFRKNSGLSFDGDPDVLAETKELDVDEPIHLWGVATRPLLLPRAPAIHIKRLIVDSDKARDASVTFPEGSIVKVDPGGEIRIGSGIPGRACAFTARKVTFDSLAAAPGPGDWLSIHVLSDCPVVLDGSVIKHADRGVQIAVGAKRVSIEHTRFDDLAGPGIEAESCAPYRDPKAGNASTGTLCSESFGLGISGIGAGGSGLYIK
jgi:hypothetical protein